MARASEDLLDALHGLVAGTLKDQIEGYVARGEPVPPQLLAQAIKFLKENGIDADPAPGSPLGALSDSLKGDLPFNERPH